MNFCHPGSLRRPLKLIQTRGPSRGQRRRGYILPALVYNRRRVMAPVKDILFIGDSLIEFFDWEERFPRHRVENLGVSGETVQWLLERIDRIVSTHPRADMVFLMTGINNLAMEEPGFIGEYREILGKLAAAYPQARIYITSLLPTLLPWVKSRAVEQANVRLRDLAEETGAFYLDIHKAFMEGNLRELLSEDGVHLSEKGYALWSRIIAGIIEPS
jgi:lysophospholipase L1-like esterase